MKNKKEKVKENKKWKWFRNLASLGIGGATMFLFPNFIITQLSFLVGILVGKGIISTALGFTITTFLGSQLGLLLQKGIIGLLSFIVSNTSLKLGGKLFHKLKPKTKKEKTKETKEIELSKPKNNNLQFEEPYEYEFIREEPINVYQPEKKYVKKLGTHPRYKK